MTEQSTSFGTLERTRPFAWLAFLAGVLSFLILIATVQPTPLAPAEQLSFFSQHGGAVALLATLTLLWAVGSIPFVVALGQLLQPKSATFALTATILSSLGILLLGFAVFAHIGALLAVVTVPNPPSAGAAIYEAAIWGNLSFYLTDPPLMAWGLGQLLFGWLAWRSGILPSWLAVVGVIGGLAGLLTLGVYQSNALALLQLASFTVWGIGTGLVLLRRRSS
jgi:Domain of unknown function (DUF4386)